MKLIVGLGNPGEKYNNSRHNLGFLTLDHLLQKLTKATNTFWNEEKKLKALIHDLDINGEKVVLMKPTTFMNESGRAVAAYAAYYKVSPEDIIIIHDELDIPLGKIRIRFGGSGGGHNGVSDIIEKLGTDKFLRVRIGIGSEARRVGPHTDTSDYVLGTFETHEKGKVKIIAELTDSRGRYIGPVQSRAFQAFPKYTIKYRAEINVRDPAIEIFWQVVNTGTQAARAGGLRGKEFFSGRKLDGQLSSDRYTNWETTAYHGIHWIECFAVKNQQLLARSGPFYVPIVNPSVGRYRRP
jgi:PTH1 family peptidyl-tRNA hydrolase